LFIKWVFRNGEIVFVLGFFFGKGAKNEGPKPVVKVRNIFAKLENLKCVFQQA